MKCEACKEYDEKIKDLFRNYFAYSLEGQIDTLEQNRLMNCTCGEAKEAAAAKAFHKVNSQFPDATTAADSFKTDWSEKSKEEILSDSKTLNELVKEREEELTLLFERLDVLDMSSEMRAILIRMRRLFNERK